MTKIILTLSFLLCTLFTQAQDQKILQDIQNANSSIKSLESHFVQTQTLAAKKKTVTTEGTLYLQDSDKMAMHYNAPSTDLLVINGNDFYMSRGGRKKLYNTAKNAMMERLQATLLHCLHGQPTPLAQKNESELSIATTKEAYIVTLTAKKKQSRGYAKIVLTYDIKTKLLSSMQMDEFNGNSTTYTMSNIKTNTSLDSAVFNVPEK